MDRVNVHPSSKAFQRMIIALVLFCIAGVIIYKASVEGWLMPREPLDLSCAPVLLFFNRYKGCACEMAVYRAAENQMDEWSAEAHHDIPIFRFDLNRRQDLGKQFNIVRAPALLLVDKEGNILYKQLDSVSDTAPLDLDALRRAIEKVTDEK